MRKTILLLTLLMTAITLFSCTNQVSFDESKNTIVIGLECTYPPFNWTETNKTETNVQINGQPGLYVEGYDVQIARLIAADLGYDLVIEMIDWDNLIYSLKVGKIDAIIAGMSPTDERKKSISFTDEYYHSTHVILTKSDNAYANAETFNDFNGARIVGQALTVYDKLAKQICEKNTNAIYSEALPEISNIITALSVGMVDVTIVEEPVAKSIVNQLSGYSYKKLTSNFEIDAAEVIVSIGIRKVDTKLGQQINEALAKISQETRNTLMERAVGTSN